MGAVRLLSRAAAGCQAGAGASVCSPAEGARGRERVPSLTASLRPRPQARPEPRGREELARDLRAAVVERRGELASQPAAWLGL